MRITTLVKHMLPQRVRPLARRLHVGVLHRLYPGMILPAEVRNFCSGLHLPTVEIADVWGGVLPTSTLNGGPGFLRRVYRPATFFDVSDRDAWKAAWGALGEPRRAAIVAAADAAVEHRFDLLGSGPVDLGGHIDWHGDFKSGARWKLLPIGKVPVVLPMAGSDIKVPWELSRFYHAPVLGAAHLITGRSRYARELVQQISDWIRNNPLGYGANWVCAMEAAIRVGNWLAALPFVMPHPAVTDEFLEMLLINVFEHGRHIRGHLEGTAQLRSNHYLADLQGLMYVGLQFPDSAEAREWVEFAHRELEIEMAWEVNPDGTGFEASTGYHRLCLELLLGPALLARANGVTFSDAFWSRLERMFLVVAELMDARGRVPLIGDNDSGRLHRVAERDDDDMAYLLSIGAALFENPALRRSGVEFSEEATLYLGPEGRARYEGLPARAAPTASAALPDSGWYVLRHGDAVLYVTCGPNGQRFRDPAPGEPTWNGGHAHNDKLAVAYTVGTRPVLVDPGQACYTSDQAQRNHSRSTSSHNVAQVAGLEQQRLRSDYLFNIHDERAAPMVERWAPEADDGPWFEGSHRGYVAGAGVVCRRSVSPAGPGAFRITDRFLPDDDASPPGEVDVTLHFHLAPGLDVTGVARDRWRLGDVAELILDDGITVDAHVDEDSVAPAYGVRRPARVLRLGMRLTPPAAVRWTIAPRPGAAPEAVVPRSRVARAGGDALHATAAVVRRLKPSGPIVARAEGAAAAPWSPILYTRLDYWNCGAVAGGSFGHTAHVVETMAALGLRVTVASGFYFPMLDPVRTATWILPRPEPATFERDYERQFFEANRAMRQSYRALAARLRPALIYERLVVGSLLGAETAREIGVPYVVEYNGSEIWARRHWAKDPYRNEDLMLEVEGAVLAAADLVVTVSDPLRVELEERGILPERILVNPNAVDPAVFDPERQADGGRAVRQRLGFAADDLVVGFIGTFGAWHGIYTLAEALADIAALDPRIRVLLIGDGELRPIVEGAIDRARLRDRVVMTGLVPQDEAAAHLAACDIFLSPHQPGPGDDRPFFGSPTKLLEYMAMARPVIASALGQIERIIDPALRVDGIETARDDTDAVGVLVTPGRADELVRAIDALRRRPALGRRLAENARRCVHEQHTWEIHVRRILERLERIVTGDAV